ncbi:MAG: Hsp20 family protein [Ignisphaera sp.]|uniref:Hsp20/alpha crystallin family protein n=1 Tax=Ignisphaera aggregans TaxID=334771 RepID=A0A832CUH4_9CREN
MEEDWGEFYRKTKKLMDKLFNEFIMGIMGFEEILGKIDEEDPNRVKVYGFRIEVGPDGVPKIYRFGETENYQRKPRVKVIDEGEVVQEPLVDIYDEGDFIRVIVELPGVNEQNIKVTPIDKKHILVEAIDNNNRYRKEIELPAEIEVKTVKTSYRNGLLEIVAKRK